MITYRKFTSLLESKGILTSEETEQLLEKFNGDEWNILMHMVARTDVSPQSWGRFWGEALGVAHVELRKTLFQSHIVRKIPVDFAKEKELIPLYRLGDVVTVATSDPTSYKALKEAEHLLGCRVSPVFSLPQEITDAIRIQYEATGIFTNGQWHTLDDVLDAVAHAKGIETGADNDAPILEEADGAHVSQSDIQKMLAEKLEMEDDT